MILILVSVLVALFLAFYIKIKIGYQYFKWHGIPGPEPIFPFGNTKSSILGQRNLIYDIDDVYRGYKDVAPFSGYYSMFSPYLLATDPALIKQMFIRDFNKFRNNDFTVDHARDPIIARNPFWLKDGEWKQRRNDATPSMTSVKLKGMYPIIVHSTKSFVAYLRRETAKDPMKAFDAREVSARYTCDAITSCTFGADAKSFTSEDPYFFEKGRQMIRGLATAIQSLRPIKMIPTEVETFFIQIAKEAIKTRLENKIKQDDFLNHIIALKEKRNMDDLDAAAECVTYFLDGFETSSVTIHHALHQLGRNKRIQEKLRAEINEKLDTEDGLSYERVMEIPYLNQVFYETLRLHPPLVMTTRVASEDVEIEGFKGHKMILKKDLPIWIPIPSIQRDPEYFPDPEAFNPERFDAEHGGVKAFKDRCVLIPFGDGPRICTGMRFAYMQVKAAIAEIVRNFEISVDSRTPSDDMMVSPVEFLNVPVKKIYLNFKPIQN